MSYQKTLVVSIVGRPNVGKSTVFNRFIHSKRKAMTHDFAGVTRDGHYAPVTFESSEHLELPEVNFILVDTGGFYPEMENKNLVELSDEDIIWAKVAGHSKVAIEESDFCLLTMDIRGGLTGADEEIVRFLRLKNKPFWILLNKCDHEGIEQYSADFARLGIDQEEMFLVSAEHALGFDELTNCLHALLNEFLKRDYSVSEAAKLGALPTYPVIGGLAIIGSPNVGKSTMLNRLIGSERSVVSPVAGTTVDPVEAYLNVDFHTDVDMVDAFWNATQKDRYLGTMQKYSQVPPNESCSRSLLILDTAGIRSKSSVEGFLETQSVFRSLRCMSESDLIIYVIDAFKGLTHQDRSLIGLAIEKGKAIILVLNKYDQVKKELPTSQERDDWYEHWTTMAPWLKHCDMIPLSAKTGEGVSKLNQKIKDYFILRAKPIPTSAINEILKKLVEEKSLNFREGKSVPFKIKYASVVKVFPVTILVFVNRSKGIPENYRKYLVNGLKDQLGWKNFPVHFIFRTNSEREERERLFQERQSESRAP